MECGTVYIYIYTHTHTHTHTHAEEAEYNLYVKDPERAQLALTVYDEVLYAVSAVYTYVYCMSKTRSALSWR